MGEREQLGELQLAIMRVLWRDGEATVADVHSQLLAARGLALTTIATMLTKMERKGVVSHRTEGRSFVYSATISEPEVQRSMVSQLTQRLFGGDVGALVSHLIREHEIESSELGELQAMVAAAERRGGER